MAEKEAFQVFRKYGTAKKRAAGRPILRIDDSLYIVGPFVSYTGIDFIEPGGTISGTISMGHLQKGNHNGCPLSASKPIRYELFRTMEEAIKAV